MNSRLLALSTLAILSAQAASANTVYFDSWTGIAPLGSDGPQSDAVTIFADSFTAATPNFNSVGLSLAADNPADGGSSLVYLVPDDGTGGSTGVAGKPIASFLAGNYAGSQLLGTILDSSLPSTGSVSASSGPSALATLPVALTPNATANDEYWLALVSNPASSVELYYNADASGTGTTGQSFANNNFDGTTSGPIVVYPDSDGPYAMTVAYDTSPVGAPEPATIAILGVGLAGLGFARRRKLG